MVKKYLLLTLLNCFVILIVQGQNNSHQGIASDSIQKLLITYVEEPPLFDGELLDFIQEEMKYPLSAIKDSIEGTVVISFIVDTLGNTIDHKIVRGVRKDVDIEALRIAKLIKYARPALQRGNPIRVPMTVPFSFKLDPMNGEEIKDSSFQTSEPSRLHLFRCRRHRTDGKTKGSRLRP